MPLVPDKGRNKDPAQRLCDSNHAKVYPIKTSSSTMFPGAHSPYHGNESIWTCLKICGKPLPRPSWKAGKALEASGHRGLGPRGTCIQCIKTRSAMPGHRRRRQHDRDARRAARPLPTPSRTFAQLTQTTETTLAPSPEEKQLDKNTHHIADVTLRQYLEPLEVHRREHGCRLVSRTAEICLAGTGLEGDRLNNALGRQVVGLAYVASDLERERS